MGVVVPAATPAALVERINQAVVAALKDPEVNAKLRAQFMCAAIGC
jgi:tripartite-type tricarboxylate transporter receptor subunit TctC